MTTFRGLRLLAPLAGLALLLLVPGLAIRAGLLPFDLRFHALLVVAAICIVVCVIGGYSAADLGLHRPPARLRPWLWCGALTLVLATSVLIQSTFVPARHTPHDWTTFVPFYLLVSSPCQELLCRSIPKLITDKVGAGAGLYVVYSSAMFAAIHVAYGDPLLLANTFVAGLGWAVVYLVSSNLWPVILSHGAIGLLAFVSGVA